MAEICESMASGRTAMRSERTSSIVKPAVFKCYQFGYTVSHNAFIYSIKYSITYKLAIHNTFAELALELS